MNNNKHVKKNTHTHTLAENTHPHTTLAAQLDLQCSGSDHNPPFKILPDKTIKTPWRRQALVALLLLPSSSSIILCVRISEVVGSHVTVKSQGEH
jgi:hypothetical protein